jgi:hypothetical protein
MRRTLVAVAALALLISAPGAQEARVMSHFVSTKDQAFFLAPASLVSGAIVESVEFSPDGRYAIVQGQDRPELPARGWLGLWLGTSRAPLNRWTQVWDTQTNRMRRLSDEVAEMLSYREATRPVMDGWARARPGSLVALVGAGSDAPRRLNWAIVRIDLASGQATPIGRITDSSGWPMVTVSPTKPIVVVYWNVPQRSADPNIVRSDVNFAVFSLDGRQLNRGNQIVDGQFMPRGWSADGNNLVGLGLSRRTPGLPSKQDTLVLNLATGVLSATDEKIALWDEPEPGPLQLTREQLQVKRGNATHVTTAYWLTSREPSDRPQTLVVTDADEAWLSPAEDKVAYVQQGRLFAREVAKVSLAEFEAAVALAERQEAMNQVKQVGIAMMIYGSDYDDRFPLNSTWKDAVLPYAKDRALFDGFVYLLNGGASTSLENPTTTEMGYKRVKSGRVVVYGDSSTRFVPDP